jgi:Ser/Thr protein kinase RdoA (MazF antagonist)
MTDASVAAARALERFGLEASDLAPLGRGLINATFRVRARAGDFVLQRLSPIFDPAIHDNIRAVSERLRARGLRTPTLVPANDGRLWIDLGAEGVWRVFDYVEGHIFEATETEGQARAAGELLGRFHAALDGLAHTFVGRRLGVHDTEAHLRTLARAVGERSGHRLWSRVAPLASSIASASAALAPLPALGERVCHGDPKLGNVLFAGAHGADRERAVCLIDLDTVAPLHLGHEIGDAWRSWCNPEPEDAPRPELRLAWMAAAWEGYRQGIGRALSGDERRALLLGPEWVSLELAARFAADALVESYFGWDPCRFASAGDHNLARAEGQWALHLATVATRAERARLLGV